MPFSGDTFTHLFDWEKDPQRQEKIINARLEAEFDGVDTGLSSVAGRVTTLEGAPAAAPTNAEYLVGTGNGTLSAERVVTNTSTVTWDLATAAQAKASAVTQLSITSDASGIKLSGDAGSPGNSKYYGTDSGGTKGYYALPSSITASSTATPSGVSTSTISSITAGKLLIISLQNLSHNSGSNQTLRLELSNDNGSNWSSVMSLSSAVSGATGVFGQITVHRADSGNAFLTGQITSTTFAPGIVNIAGPFNAARLSWSAGNFDQGDWNVYSL